MNRPDRSEVIGARAKGIIFEDRKLGDWLPGACCHGLIEI